jgi:hypothetical protein
VTEPQRKIERETDLRLKTAGSILKWGFGTCFRCGCVCSQSQPIFWGLLVRQIIFARIAVWRGLSLPWNNMLFKTTRCTKMWLRTPTLGLKANWCVRKKISTQSAKWPTYRAENGYPIYTPSDEWQSNPLIRFGNIVWVTENKQNKIYTINEKGQNKSKRKLNSFIQGRQIRKRTNDKRYPLLVTAVWKTSSHWIKGVVQISPNLTTPQHSRLPPWYTQQLPMFMFFLPLLLEITFPFLHRSRPGGVRRMRKYVPNPSPKPPRPSRPPRGAPRRSFRKEIRQNIQTASVAVRPSTGSGIC